MPTRLRPVFIIGGEPRTGGYARLSLESYAKNHIKIPKRGSMPETERLIQMFKALPTAYEAMLLLLREPRAVDKGRSRYAKVCDYYGVKARSKKKKASERIADLLAAAEPPQFRFRNPPRRWVTPQPTISNPVPEAAATFRWDAYANATGQQGLGSLNQVLGSSQVAYDYATGTITGTMPQTPQTSVTIPWNPEPRDEEFYIPEPESSSNEQF